MNKLLTLFFCCVSYANAALTYTVANAGHVDVAAATSINNLTVWTAAAWVYPAGTISANERIFQKALSPNQKLLMTPDGSGNLECDFARSTLGSYISNNTPLVTLNKWYFVACVADSGASAGNIVHIYVGDATTPLAEVTYGTKTDGTGSTNTDSGTALIIGGRPTGGSGTWVGDIDSFMYWNRALSLGELKAQQFAMHKTSGNVIFIKLGANGVGTQADWSGNLNNGTVTGATLSTRVAPVAPFSAFVHYFFPTLPAWWHPTL